MKRPAKARVLGNLYKILFVPGSHKKLEGDMGNCEFDELVMYINDAQPFSNEQRTVFHECLEALNEGMKIKLRHDQIEQLEIGLMALFQENPSLMVYLRRKNNGRTKGDEPADPRGVA